MTSIKSIAAIGILASLLTLGIFVLINSHTESIAAGNASGAVIAQPDRQLCARLVRFGQVAFDRGQFAEAKHFYQKAIMVDPHYLPAWKKYNHALLALISDRVETDPGFLPELAPDSEDSVTSETIEHTSSETAQEDDGC